MSNKMKSLDKLLDDIFYLHQTLDIKELISKYIDNPTLELKDKLLGLADNYEKDVLTTLENTISKIKERNLEHLIGIVAIEYLREHINPLKLSEEEKRDKLTFFNSFIAPVKQLFGDLDMAITIRAVTSSKTNVRYETTLIKSIAICDKYCKKALNGLPIEVSNKLTFELLRFVFNMIYVVFNKAQSDEYHKAYDEIIEKQIALSDKYELRKQSDIEHEMYHAEYSLLEEEVKNIDEKYKANVIGYNDLILLEKKDIIDFNFLELKKYIQRIIKYGAYKDIEAKSRVFNKILGVSEDNNNKPFEITQYKYRDTLTTDYSDRMNCILQVLKENGTKTAPAQKNKDGFTVYKTGPALDDSDIELFHYLIGELEEHGCEHELVFRRADIVNNMGYSSLRGTKLDNLTSSLMNLNAQSIAILDERKDTAGRRLKKADYTKFKGTQLLRADFESHGDELLIKFISPFSKYFRQQKQFGRILSRDMLNKHLYTNTRVLKISRELSRMLFINSQKNRKISSLEINSDTLIKKIDEWERYSNAKNKRDYLLKLNRDIEKACGYIKTQFEYEVVKATPRTLKNGKIKLFIK